jgi:hypothetical protein
MDAVRRFWVDTEFLRRIAPAKSCAPCADGTGKAVKPSNACRGVEIPGVIWELEASCLGNFRRILTGRDSKFIG